MDIGTLHALFESTLDPSDQARSRAELALNEFSCQPHFVNGCLSIVLEPAVLPPIRVAAAVYLKNKVIAAWTDTVRQTAGGKIPDQDKQQFRLRLVDAISQVPVQVRQILLRTLGCIITADFKVLWPDLMPVLVKFLNDKNPNVVYTGLSIFLQVSRRFRWSTAKGYDLILEQFYPIILQIAEALVHETSQLAAMMVYDITKIYKLSIARTLPPILQVPEIATRTAAVMLNITIKALPAEVLSLDSGEKEWHPWCKAKKWATFDLLRIQVVYLSKKTRLSDKAQQYTNFRKMYRSTITPEVTKVFITEMEKWAEGKTWLPQSALYNILSFLEASVESKQSWGIIQPHIEGIITHVIYPLMCPTEDDLDLFDDDPVEYVHKYIDIYSESPFVDVAASNLLSRLAQKRQVTFLPIVEFVQKTVHELTDDSLATAVKKVGVIRMLQTLSLFIMNHQSPIKDQMEGFLAQYIVPDFESSHGILKSRACQIVSAFASVKFQNRENLQKLYSGTLKCLYDVQNLPVQVEAALTLQSLSTYDDVHAALGTHVTEIVQIILNLTKKIDLDSLLGVMDEFVTNFPEQITPFAVEMARQLRDQFMVLAGELHEAGLTSAEDYEFSTVAEDKTATGLGLLKSIASLQLSLQPQKELLFQLEEVIVPIFDVVYRHELQDFYTEAFSLHENTLYTSQKVTPSLWSLLKVSVDALEKSGFVDFVDALPMLENYINYGADFIAQNEDAQNLFVQLISGMVATSQMNVQLDDRIAALTLGARLLESPELRNENMARHLDAMLVPVLDRMVVDKSVFQTVPSYAFNLASVVLASLFNNCAVALACLESRNMTEAFLVTWMQCLDNFTTVNDLKLQEFAILALLSVDTSLPPAVQAALPQILEVLSRSLEALPGAIARRAELLRELDDSAFDDGPDFESVWDVPEEDDEDEYEDVSVHVQKPPAQATEEPTAPTSGSDIKFEYYAPEDFGDDSCTESPLDSLDAFTVLRDTLNNISHASPGFYQRFTGMLSEQDKGILQESAARAG